MRRHLVVMALDYLTSTIDYSVAALTLEETHETLSSTKCAALVFLSFCYRHLITILIVKIVRAKAKVLNGLSLKCALFG